MMRRKIAALLAVLLAVLFLLSACGQEETGIGEAVSTMRVTEALDTATPEPERPAPEKPDEPERMLTPEPTNTPGLPDPTETPETPIIDPQEMVDYLYKNGRLPDNFITKNEAKALGWDSSVNYLSDVAPGKSIGGDRFGNYEGRLPKVKGRTYYEADCWYTGGKRNAFRLIWSGDGHYWYTEDHYNTFTELFPSQP